jgi:hypothetical protein
MFRLFSLQLLALFLAFGTSASATTEIEDIRKDVIVDSQGRVCRIVHCSRAPCPLICDGQVVRRPQPKPLPPQRPQNSRAECARDIRNLAAGGSEVLVGPGLSSIVLTDANNPNDYAIYGANGKREVSEQKGCELKRFKTEKGIAKYDVADGVYEALKRLQPAKAPPPGIGGSVVSSSANDALYWKAVSSCASVKGFERVGELGGQAQPGFRGAEDEPVIVPYDGKP